MFHVNNNDEAGPCRAKKPEACRFYKGENDTRHYENVVEAQKFIEKKLEAEHGIIKKEVRYSFVKAFKEQEEKFNEDFEGFPNRFFNTDLREKFVPNNASDDQLLLGYRSFNRKGLHNRLLASASQPADNKMNTADVLNLLEQQNFENVVEITDPQILQHYKSNRAWKASLEGMDTVIIDGNSGTSLSSKYAFRNSNDYFAAYSYFHKFDVRKIAANNRIQKKTGSDLIKHAMMTDRVKKSKENFQYNIQEMRENVYADDSYSEEDKKKVLKELEYANYEKANSISVLTSLEDAQLEGKNFIAQKKYVKNHSGSIATAYMDKKNPDKIHQNLMENNSLNKYFRKVEIDNKVDPAEFVEFAKNYEAVRDILPKIPQGKEPELRIRKLGKHKAHGLFYPHKNTVCIDVETSGSFIHEMAHQYDLAIKDNASLRSDFRSIQQEYSRSLRVPAGEPDSRFEYLTTPTEVFARSFEWFAHDRLGIQDKLVDSKKFDNYDHAPFKDNPALREKIFSFIDKLYEEDK